MAKLVPVTDSTNVGIGPDGNIWFVAQPRPPAGKFRITPSTGP
jgi:hypothetical protein